MWYVELDVSVFNSHQVWVSVFCLLDFSASCSHLVLYDLDLGVEVLGSPVLVVGVSSAAAFNSGLKKERVKKEKKKRQLKMAPCLVQCVCTEVKRFFFFSKKELN